MKLSELRRQMVNPDDWATLTLALMNLLAHGLTVDDDETPEPAGESPVEPTKARRRRIEHLRARPPFDRFASWAFANAPWPLTDQTLIGDEDAPEPAKAGEWDESEHPRHPAGSAAGGEFAPKGAGTTAEAPHSFGFSVDTRSAAYSALAAWGETWGKALTADERDAVITYTGSIGMWVNTALRGNEASLDADVRQELAVSDVPRMTSLLDSALAKASLPRALVVSRLIAFKEAGDSRAAFVQGVRAAFASGSVWTDAGYVSTALHLRRTPSEPPYNKNLVVNVRLTLPKGSTAAYVESVSLHTGEREVLLPRNSRFRVTSVDGDGAPGTYLTLEMELLRDDAAVKAGEWDEFEHPRHPAGVTVGGQFAPKDAAAGGQDAGTSPAGSRQTGEDDWEPDPSAHYIRPVIADKSWAAGKRRPDEDVGTVAATKRWANELQDRGWTKAQIDEILAKSTGWPPQLWPRNYGPEWGTGPGEWTAYRAGGLDNASGRGIWFGPDADELDGYASMNGAPIKAYTVKTERPAVFKNKSELIRAWMPSKVSKGTQPGTELREWIYRLDTKKGGPAYRDPGKAEAMIDQEIQKQMLKRGHDAVVLMWPGLPATREIMVASAASVKEKS